MDYYELRWINKFNYVFEIIIVWLGKVLNNCLIFELNNFLLLLFEFKIEIVIKFLILVYWYYEFFWIVWFFWIE